MLLPGILRDPSVYELLAALVPTNFYLMAVLGGGVATFCKRVFGLDLRGRILELVVVCMTLWLVGISWGLVWAFFGTPETCVGVFQEQQQQQQVPQHGTLEKLTTRLLLRPLRAYVKLWEGLLSSHKVVSRWVCVTSESHCFAHTPILNPDTLWEEPLCANDLRLVVWLWMTGVATLLMSTLWKKRRRPRPQPNHPHQD
eukprot:CAMPEP_0116850510 /NCGR_PEP_ID=MMETSP0418-20121206/16195_1 /TAXON_ID=1158023 /ORGANISM="Astrosyne radiata, Strain 13vi08-1A" /LENGTH=198 /DNA_ID=CAMNT_0004482405 /DNA_START=281 /DNA_END=877 /DNA_ORIENTATION=+